MNAMRSQHLVNCLLRSLCAAYALLSVSAAAGQEMIGPSSTTPREPTNPVYEAPEELTDDDAVEDPADAQPRETIGSDDVLLAPEPTERSFEYATAWQALMDSQEHEEAVALAKVWVSDATVQFGKRAPETFIPITRLADAYAANNEIALAAKTYADAVVVGERRLGPFSPSLVEPLVGLGTVLAIDRDHEGAVSALRRAKDITHRNKGIYNPDQAPIVDKLTSSYVQLDEVRQATREQLLLFGAQARLVGEDSVEFVPALQKWANWNARIQRFSDARRYFYEAIDLLEKEYGPNDVRLIETLNMIADSFKRNMQTNFPREGARALRRAVDIYKAQETVDQIDLLRAHTRLGDWYLLAGRRTRGVEVYKEAIAEARDAGLPDEVVDAAFAAPLPLTNNSQPIGIWGEEHLRVQRANGSVTLEFDVDGNGRPRNIRVIEDTVNVVEVLKLIRQRHANSKYRPRFVDGQPVMTRGVRFIYEF